LFDYEQIREYHKRNPSARVVDTSDAFEELLKEEPVIEFSGEVTSPCFLVVIYLKINFFSISLITSMGNCINSYCQNNSRIFLVPVVELSFPNLLATQYCMGSLNVTWQRGAIKI
jgi:hypothetical protein